VAYRNCKPAEKLILKQLKINIVMNTYLIRISLILFKKGIFHDTTIRMSDTMNYNTRRRNIMFIFSMNE
jgi:hypothetical protein